jgi:hypothetical protein
MSNLKLKLILPFSIFLLLWIACRKLDNQPFKKEETENSSTKKFFNEHLPTNPSVIKILEYALRQNKKYDFVRKIINQVGYPRWNKTIITSSEIGIS